MKPSAGGMVHLTLRRSDLFDKAQPEAILLGFLPLDGSGWTGCGLAPAPGGQGQKVQQPCTHARPVPSRF